MIDEYAQILAASAEKKEFIQRQMKYLGKFNIKNFDHIVHDYHDEAFEEIDCLQCGNCCRFVGPAFHEAEIKRIVKLAGLDHKRFVREKLFKDDALGWILKSLPCPFLCTDNSCSIYEERPRSCMDYPYTLERGIHKSLLRLARNTGFCPAACLIVDKITTRFADGVTK